MFAKHNNFDYYYHLPEGYNPEVPTGIIFSMHGAGRRMTQFDPATFITAFEKEVETGNVKTDCIVISPACPAGFVWFDFFEQLKAFIEEMVEKFNGDRTRIYLTGVSMGGYCSWQLLMSMPFMFRRALILCGGGMYWNAARIKAEVRAYHGTVDPCVFFEESRKMVDAVNANGGKATLYPLDGVGHNAWDYVYGEQEIIDWLTEKA